jgi:PKD repeat protein
MGTSRTGWHRRGSASLGVAAAIACGLFCLLPAGTFGTNLPGAAGAPPPLCVPPAPCVPPGTSGPGEPNEWRELSAAGHLAPSPRSASAAAYDPSASAVILFGGRSATGEPLGDTWEFSRGAWTPLTVAGPSPRWGASAAYDPLTGRLVLFGGENATGPLADTWTFNGSAWRLLPTLAAPSPREDAAVVYDPVLQGILLFGGSPGGPIAANDTWVFSDGGWERLGGSLQGAPAPLEGPELVYLPNASMVLLEGAPQATGVGPGASGSEWSLVGTRWSPMAADGPLPPARAGAAFASDPPDGSAVLFGGWSVGPSEIGAARSDTWVYRDGAWANQTLSLSTAPEARSEAAAAYDPMAGGVIVVGGTGATGTLGDSWAYGAIPLAITVRVSPTSGESPLNASFEATIQGGSPPYRSNWTFGDGEGSGDAANATHEYVGVGTYQAQLVVNDSAGGSASVSVTIHVLTSWEAAHQWGELSVPASRAPSPRWSAQAAYDPPIEAGLMFGGELSNGAAANDTWEFVDGVWFNLSANLSVAPGARWGGALAYDPSAGDLVLFGGAAASHTYNDTWTYSPAVGWQEIPTDTAPSPRVFAAFVDDPALGADLLFGGGIRSAGGGWTIYNDTWEWRNGAWTNLTSPLIRGPPPTIGASLSYDSLTGELLMFGGSALPPGGTPGTCYPDAELWVFAGDQWTLSTSANPPTDRLLSASAFLPAEGSTVVFGGAEARNGACGAGGDTWSYSNATWTNISGGIEVTPPSRSAAAALYDAQAGVFVLFGGDENGLALNDTWVYPAILNESSTTSTQETSGASPGNPNGSGGSGPGNTSTGGSGAFTVGYTISGSASPEPDLVRFSATETGGVGPFVVSWYFGDSSPSAIGANVTHSYTLAGDFEAVLTVIDSTGQTVVELVGPVNVLPAVPAHTGPASITPAGIGTGWVFPVLGLAAVGVVLVAVLVELRQRRLREEGNALVREIEDSKNP